MTPTRNLGWPSHCWNLYLVDSAADLAMISDTVIVSGLPRSGTSLMMQMLDRGGVEVASDYQRQADEDNPRGYFEIEAVKQLQKDAAWLPEMRGKALKVISQLLFALPDTQNYHVLLMQRDLDEVLASQAAMLVRRGRLGAAQTETLRKAFIAHQRRLEDWLPKQQHLKSHKINYADVVAEPLSSAEEIARFLGIDLDVAAMAAAVDPSLYRNRAEKH